MKSGIIDQPPTKKHTNGNGRDRISELPDSVLHHILSFLTTKDSVQTSILSKRWTHLWASVPALDFSDDSFSGADSDESFKNFVDTVLLLRDAIDLCSFRMRCCNYIEKARVYRWIRYATKHNMKVLQIEFPEGVLPLGILPCRTLEELSIINVELGPPKIMGCLRRLHIQWAYGEDLDLISSCPVLEDLDLYESELFALRISSNTLKRLSISDCKIGGNENMISIPSLVCLTYTYNSGCTTLENLSSLLNATVHTTCEHTIELIRGLANVETLNFSLSEDHRCYTRFKLPEDLSQLPTFDNLRSLTSVRNCTSDMIQVVAFFLQRSPNLKSVTLDTTQALSLCYTKCKLPKDLSQLPTFDNLRNLTLVGKNAEAMIQVVAFFLQRSPNLKTFTLNTRKVSPRSLSRWKVVVPEVVDALLR